MRHIYHNFGSISDLIIALPVLDRIIVMAAERPAAPKPFACPFERCLSTYTRRNKLTDHLIKRKSYPDEIHPLNDPTWHLPTTTQQLTCHTRPKNLTEEERAARRKASQLRCWRKNKEVYQLNKKKAQEEIRGKLKIIQDLAEMYHRAANATTGSIREMYEVPPGPEEWVAMGDGVDEATVGRIVVLFLPYERWPGTERQRSHRVCDLMPGLSHKNDLAVLFHENLAEELLATLNAAWDFWCPVVTDASLLDTELFT